MAAYQTVAPLTIGELWAWPSMLKLALLESLRRLADETLQGRDARLTADGYLAQIGGAEDTAPLASLPEVLRSEEHTSELQSRLHLVCRLLLEKKKKKKRLSTDVHKPS